MNTNDKIKKLTILRKHPSFGMLLTPLVSLLPVEADIPQLPDPAQTGTLASSEISTLSSIACYPAIKWGIPQSFSAFDIDEFTGFVSLKTQQAPSYFTAYQQMLEMYALLLQSMTPPQAMDYIFTPDPVNPPPDWATVSYWVTQEFLSLFVTSGNFRYYGWVNYPGWMGGPYNDPNHLPYRT